MPPWDLREKFEQSRPITALSGGYSLFAPGTARLHGPGGFPRKSQNARPSLARPMN
jgi:hypothetical protein